MCMGAGCTGAHRYAARLAAGLLGFASGTACAAPCAGVDQTLTAARGDEYARLVAEDLRGDVKPSQIKVLAFMREAPWSVAYVSTPISDDGYFFFEERRGTKRAKDVWGGMAQPSEKPELVAWARKLGAPEKLARCFALHAAGG
jgi:hypothetical protein